MVCTNTSSCVLQQVFFQTESLQTPLHSRQKPYGKSLAISNELQREQALTKQLAASFIEAQFYIANNSDYSNT